MRTLSLNMRQALFAQESGEVAIFLLTITHPQLDQPIRLSSDPTQRMGTDPLYYATVSRANEYKYVGMEITLPDEQDQSPPSTRMVIGNVDRSIVPLARSVTSPASVKIEIVLASDPDTVELSVPALNMVSLDYDVLTLTFDLAMDAFATEPYPAGNFDPGAFPSLFF